MLMYTVITILSIHYSYSQDNYSIQRSSIGVHLIADHFPQRESIHLPGSDGRLTIGLAVSFLKGITPRLDMQTTLAVSFPRLAGKDNGGRHAFGEMDASLRGKLVPGNPRLIPFLQAGAGLAVYDGHVSAIFPAGAGIQINLPGETFLLFHAQYRITTAPAWDPAHLYYSAGIAGIIGKKRNIRTRRRPVLPPATSSHHPTSFSSRDRDGDGIADSLDACPDTPGDIALAGCPVIDTSHSVLINDMKEKLKEDAKNIFFETDRYTLLPASFKALDAAAALLTTHPQFHLLIEGHTDSTGRPDANQALSQHRAEAVRDYMIQKGIAKERLSAKGYGSKRPIAGNDTPSGRSLNRRVELIPYERP